jgi:hypothetical protein
MQFIKTKTSIKQFPVCKPCHVTDNWHDTYLWYVGSPLVVTQRNRGNEQCTRVRIWNPLAAPHQMGWPLHSRYKLDKLLSKFKLQQSRAHWVGSFFSDVFPSLSREANNTIKHLYLSFTVLSWPSKCQSFLQPWHTAIVSARCKWSILTMVYERST